VKRYLVREQGTGARRYFSSAKVAITFAGQQAAAAWRSAAEWSVVDRRTDGRIVVDALGVIRATVGEVAPSIRPVVSA
jgi:hypothetical protein